MSSDMNIGFIGAGNMAQAIAKGLLETFPANRIHVAAPTDRNLSFFQELGCTTTHKNDEVVERCQVVFLCFKPNQCEIASREIPISQHSSTLFISVVAGVPIEKFTRLLKRTSTGGLKMIRCVPNTPMLISKGVCCLSPGPGVSVDDIQLAIKLLKPCCIVVKTVPESQLDAICALSGSGPAFIYSIIEALSDAAVKMGLSRELATELSACTVEGAARMVTETGKHPAQLKDAVCSPGGTTIAGIHELEKGNIRATLMNAIEASTLRSIELNKQINY